MSEGRVREVAQLCASRDLHQVRGYDGYSLLFEAARYNGLSLVESMLKNRFDVWHKDVYGYNVLHEAAINESVEVTEHLCRSYPRLMEMKDNRGMTPRDWAKQYNRQRAVETFDKILAEQRKST